MTDVSVPVSVPDEVLQAAIHKSILESLDKRAMDEIVKQTVSYLTTPRDTYRGSGSAKVSPLLDIVFRESEELTRSIVREKLIADPDFQKQLQDLYVTAFQRMFSPDHKEEIVKRLAEYFDKALRGDRY